jgi:hypothetical protein
MAEDPIHPVPTRRNRRNYLLSGEHHSGGSASDAKWTSAVSQAEEFSVFDNADYHDLSEERGWLYGVLRTADARLRYIETWNQQVAEFPYARDEQPWHGATLSGR